MREIGLPRSNRVTFRMRTLALGEPNPHNSAMALLAPAWRVRTFWVLGELGGMRSADPGRADGGGRGRPIARTRLAGLATATSSRGPNRKFAPAGRSSAIASMRLPSMSPAT